MMRRHAFSVVRAAFYALLVLIGSAGFAIAQFKAGIEGTVTDTSSAGVGGATVSVTSQETAKTQQATTDLAGFYRVSGLAPGKYTVTVSFAGFKEEVVSGVAVTAEETKAVDVVIQPGELKEVVTVSAEAAPQLQTENANVTGNISNQEVHALPQAGRDPYELVRLAPGVFGDGARQGDGSSASFPNSAGPGGSNSSIFQTENQLPISGAGQRLTDNNFQIDGVSVNSLGFGGAAVVTPNQESVKEIKVSTNAYDSQYGRNSGAQIEVVSQNGTNKFHGSGFFKYDQPGLNAFNKYGGPGAQNPVRVEDKSRNFGGSIGGPIWKDKLFFFVSYEGLRNKTSSIRNQTYIETTQYQQSVIAARSGSVTSSIFQSPGLQPRIAQVLAPSCSIFAPGNCQVVGNGLDIGSLTGAVGTYVNPNVRKDALNPNGDPNGDFTGGGLDGVPDLQLVTLLEPRTTSGHQYNTRVDFQHGNDSFAVSTYISRLNSLTSDGSGDSRPMGDVLFKPFNSAATLTWNRILSPTTLNQARINFTRFSDNGVADATLTNFGIPRVEVESYPFDRIRFGAPQNDVTPSILTQNTIEFRDTLNHVMNNHSLKFGVEIRKEQDNNNLLGGVRPDYSFSGLWNLANGTPIFEGINVDPRTGAPGDTQRYFRTSDYGLFGQDDVKVRPNLTINFGLRWEYYTPLTEKRGRLSNLIFSSPGDLKNAKLVVVNQLYNADYSNFAPRLGFAYSPSYFTNKLVVRGGFGVFHNRIPDVLFTNNRLNPPFVALNGICCGTATTWFSTPFAGGKISYVKGTTKSPSSFPANPALAYGIDPKTNGECADPACTSDNQVQVYGSQPNEEVPYVYEYSLGFEYTLANNWIAAIGYEGSAGHKLVRIVNQSFLYANNASFSPVYFPQPDTNSNFNALNTRLTHQFSRNFQTEIRYRFSKSIDQLSYEGPCACDNQTWPQNDRTERGPSDYDATHYLTWSGVWDLPILRGRDDLVGKALGGWQVSGIMTAHSGFPWTPVTGYTCIETPGGPGLCPARPIAEIATPLNDHSNAAFIRAGGNFPGGGTKYFTPNPNFAMPLPPGIGRNSFRGPHYFGSDMTLAKQFRVGSYSHLGEAAKIDVRANLFNIFNQLNLAPFGFNTNATNIQGGTFGQADAGLAGRVIEFQARLSF